MKRQGGWWKAGLAAALLVPALGIRPAAAGPFDYVRQADTTKNQGQHSTPPAPSPPRSEPARPTAAPPSFHSQGPATPSYRPQAPLSPSNPFGTFPRERGAFPGSPVSPSTPFSRPNSPAYHPSPFGTVRPVTPFIQPGSPRVESPSTPGASTGSGNYQQPYERRGYPPSFGNRGSTPSPGSRGYLPPLGRVRGQVGGGSAAAPLPRGGRGTLGSYFGREAREHRQELDGWERRHHRHGYPYYLYPPAPYYYVCPYDLYPPQVYYFPEPYPVYVPETEVEVVPVPEAGEEYSGVTLDDLIAEIEEAWESGKLDLLMRHVRRDTGVQVYRNGESIDSLSRSEFEEKTAQAFRDYDTLSLRFEQPELLGRDETGLPAARAEATHIYRTRDGVKHHVGVTYAFRKYGGSWYVVGLDYVPSLRQDAAAPESAPAVAALATRAPESAPAAVALTAAASAAPRATVRHASLAEGQLRLVSAPPVRLRELLNAHAPRPLAAVKWLHAGGRSFYTVQAMRGIAPETVTWALYRKGVKRPVETGVTDVSALPANGWVAVRPQGLQLVTLASRGSAARRPVLRTRAFGDASLVLVPAQPPVKAHANAGRRARHERKRRAHHA